MAKKSNLILSEGEEIKVTLPAELDAITSNLLINILLKIKAFFAKLFGYNTRAQLIVTNTRCVLEMQTIAWWCIETSATFTTYLPQAIASVGYSYVPTFCCCLCRKYAVTMTFANGGGFNFVIKGGEKEATEVCNAMTAALAR